MDIDLPDFKGHVATKLIREIEKPFNIRTKIAAVTVETINGTYYYKSI